MGKCHLHGFRLRCGIIDGTGRIHVEGVGCGESHCSFERALVLDCSDLHTALAVCAPPIPFPVLGVVRVWDLLYNPSEPHCCGYRCASCHCGGKPTPWARCFLWQLCHLPPLQLNDVVFGTAVIFQSCQAWFATHLPHCWHRFIGRQLLVDGKDQGFLK